MIRVATVLQPPSSSFYAYLNSLEVPLADRGVQIVGQEDAHDLMMIDAQSLIERYESVESIDRPLVVYERKDAATVAWKMRKWLASPRVCLWLKTTAFRDPADYNVQTSNVHIHVDRIIEASGEAVPPPRYRVPKISDEQLAKVRAFAPVYMFSQFDYIRELALRAPNTAPLRKRPIDLICAGRTDHSWPVIQVHRDLANRAAVALKHRNVVVGRERVFDRPDYYRFLGGAKISLSAFGLGEMNWKDWEAVLTGTIIVKPPVHYVTTAWYDIYRQGGATIDCAIDFSDLPQVVERVLSDLDKHQERTEMERQALLACCDRESLATQFADMVKEASARA